jgi:hypothetical protein
MTKEDPAVEETGEKAFTTEMARARIRAMVRKVFIVDCG